VFLLGPESRRVCAAGPRPTSPREGALQRLPAEPLWEGLNHKPPRTSLGAPTRGRARPSAVSAPNVCIGTLPSSGKTQERAASDRRVGAATLVLGTLSLSASHRSSAGTVAKAPARGGGRALPGGAARLDSGQRKEQANKPRPHPHAAATPYPIPAPPPAAYVQIAAQNAAQVPAQPFSPQRHTSRPPLLPLT
jgi:hypothetical protein